MPKIVSFNWDSGKGEEWNGNHLVIGQLLPKTMEEDSACVPLYGFCLDIANTAKDFQLTRLSFHSSNMVSDAKEITKEAARTALILEIDKCLNILFDENEMATVDRKLNQPHPENDDENNIED